MGMGIGFANPMGMGMGMGMIFENWYECGYSSTRPVPIPSLGTLVSGVPCNLKVTGSNRGIDH